MSLSVWGLERRETCNCVEAEEAIFATSESIFSREKGEKIVDIFGARLAMEEVKLDLLDKIVDFLHI